MKSKIGACALLLTIAAASCILVYYLHEKYQAQKNPNKALNLFHEIMQHYEKGEFTTCVEKALGHENELINLQEGCELLISSLALIQDFSRLSAIAKSCADAGKASGMAEEAYAYSFVERGQASAAIPWLKERIKIAQEARAKVALARIYLLLDQAGEASDLYFEAMNESELWSIWLAQILQETKLTSNKEFISRLIAVVEKKERNFPKLEKRLLEAAKKLGIESVSEQFLLRLEVEDEANS